MFVITAPCFPGMQPSTSGVKVPAFGSSGPGLQDYLITLVHKGNPAMDKRSVWGGSRG